MPMTRGGFSPERSSDSDASQFALRCVWMACAIKAADGWVRLEAGIGGLVHELKLEVRSRGRCR